MVFKNVKESLVALAQGECSSADAADLHYHLERCASCAQDFKDLSHALGQMREGHQEIPIPEGALERLLKRIAEEKESKAKKPVLVSSARSGQGTLPSGVRRSPAYLAISISLHAAALAVLVGVPLLLNSLYGDRDVPNQPVVGVSSERQLFLVRQEAEKGTRTIENGSIETGSFLPAEVFYLLAAESNTYLAAYPTGGRGLPSEVEFLNMLNQSGECDRLVRCTVSGGMLAVPATLVQSAFGESRQVYLVNLMGEKTLRRVEIWSHEKWEHYLATESAAGRTPDRAILFARALILTPAGKGGS